MPKLSDNIENLTEEDFIYYTIAFLIKLLGKENYEETLNDCPQAQLNYNNYKNLPIQRRLKYETNIFDKYWRVVKKWQNIAQEDN